MSAYYPTGSSGGWWQNITSATSNVTIFPQSVVVHQPPTPKPVGPLDWLREQVAEVCDLARAA